MILRTLDPVKKENENITINYLSPLPYDTQLDNTQLCCDTDCDLMINFIKFNWISMTDMTEMSMGY